MAIEKLPVDFQEDVINLSVNDKRQYQMISNPNGTVSLEDTTVYEKVGSYFGSEQINQTNGAVNGLIDKTSNIDNTADSEKNVLYAETAGSAKTADSSKSCDNDFILCNQQVIAFIGNSCIINNERITADSLADVYFTQDTIEVAEEAVISVETYDGSLSLSSIRTPSGEIKASIKVRVV